MEFKKNSQNTSFLIRYLKHRRFRMEIRLKKIIFDNNLDAVGSQKHLKKNRTCSHSEEDKGEKWVIE